MQRIDPSGAPESWTSLLEDLAPEFHAIAARHRLPAAEFDDCCQETALAYLSYQRPIQTPRAWLLRVFRNRCVTYWRRRRSQFAEEIDRALLEEVPASRDDRQQRDLARDLRSALARLPERCRNLLGMRYGLELTSPQIAATLGARAAAVRQATRRCLSALSRCLVTPEPPVSAS